MSEVLPEKETMEAIRNGDTTAFRRVFDAGYEDLCRYAYTILKDAAEAEDTVQSMFVKLWEKRGELEITQSVRSYLFRSVYNLCVNKLEHQQVRRRHQVTSQATLSLAVQPPEVFTNELDDRIRKIVDKLPAQCRTIFIMSRYEELRYVEIAEKLNISVNTIQNQVCKALKILREELKDSIL
jgi:RNA polymerase sigma-70 factor, ECF subfamily